MSDLLLLLGVLLLLSPLVLLSLFVYAPVAGLVCILAAVLKEGDR
jgi:hypothetical protein